MEINLFFYIFTFSLFLTTIKSSDLRAGIFNNIIEKEQQQYLIDTTSNQNHQNVHNDTHSQTTESGTTQELIPDPSALIIPGYNLPGPLFNNGKPFYVEKDPITGAINFNNKSSAGKDYISSEYDYVDEEPQSNFDIYDKANIDRKDTNYGSHRPNDINQLSPNFHDFLNLPVKYNPEKYVYPLISSSYANTKIQGNVNNYNHKQYTVTTQKSTVSPNYYTTKPTFYYEQSTTTTQSPSSTFKTTTSSYTTKEEKITKTPENLMNNAMNHPSYLTTVESDYDYDYYAATKEPFDNHDVHFTTEPPRTYLSTSTNKPSTTKKPYSIFDELFGDYEEETTEQKLPSLISNIDNNDNDKINKVTQSSIINYDSNKITQTSSTTKSPTSFTTKTTETPNVNTQYLSHKTEANVHQVYPEEDNAMYEYEDEYSNYSEESDSQHSLTTNKPELTQSKQNRTEYRVSTETSVVINIRNETSKPTIATTERNQDPASKNIENIKNKYNTTRYSDRFDIIPDITTERQENNQINKTEKITKPTQTELPQTTKVTSMPLGENHPPSPKLPVITLMQNLKESLNREKVETTTKLFINSSPSNFMPNFPNKHILHPIPSTSNIHIAPDQDMVSFIVGNHQNVDGGHYIGTAVKEEPYISNSFRPLYTNQNSVPVFDQIIFNKPPVQEAIVNNLSPPTTTKINNSLINTSTTISVQPIIGSQASLSIGVPADDIKTKPGQVVDEKLDINDNIEYPKETETKSKVVFPKDELTFTTSKPIPNREILSLYSKPMFHQLPADLTPPQEQELKPIRPGSQRPPWDPRPGHFYQGRPEYARPPRPHKPEVYKRIDGLPNILPQFRPNAKVSSGHYLDSVGTINAGGGYMPRQPLLERPSNRPIGFFEKLHPPPPPKRIHDLRKVTSLEPQELKHDRYRYEERILTVPNKPQEHYNMYQMPPKVPVANRKTEDETEIATLQMIQSKQTDKLETIKPNVPPPFKINYQQETTEKPLYVVYPVNSAPLKLDVLDSDKRETVVVGTRGEQIPLPPSKINQESSSSYEQKPLLQPKDRIDSPILKPHIRPNIFPIKSDFPYILEKPDPTLINIPLSSSNPSLSPNLNLELSSPNINLESTLSTAAYSNDYNNNYESNNQWTSLDAESRIVNSNNKQNYVNDQISATLKTYTEKPIAIAYTPTEPTYNINSDKYSMPNFGRPVISEIRPDGNKNNINPYGSVSDDNEFTVSAVMHTHPQIKLNTQNEIKYFNPDQKTVSPILSSTKRMQENLENHKLNLDIDTTHVPAKLDFQAPFHASLSVDSEYQGWSVLNQKKDKIDRSDTEISSTHLPETSSEFDIENFKPQLFGGFKPIYTYGNEPQSSVATIEENKRQE